MHMKGSDHPPLDSQTVWTEDFWSNTAFLTFQYLRFLNKENHQGFTDYKDWPKKTHTQQCTTTFVLYKGQQKAYAVGQNPAQELEEGRF